MFERKRVFIETIEPICCSNPKKSILIFMQGEYFVGTNAVWLTWIMLIADDLTCGSCKTIEPFAKRTHPDIALRVSINGPDGVITQRILVLWVVTVIGKMVAPPVISIYTTGKGSKP